MFLLLVEKFLNLWDKFFTFVDNKQLMCWHRANVWLEEAKKCQK
jgi:hypothetical protein